MIETEMICVLPSLLHCTEFVFGARAGKECCEESKFKVGAVGAMTSEVIPKNIISNANNYRDFQVKTRNIFLANANLAKIIYANGKRNKKKT